MVAFGNRELILSAVGVVALAAVAGVMAYRVWPTETPNLAPTSTVTAPQSMPVAPPPVAPPVAVTAPAGDAARPAVASGAPKPPATTPAAPVSAATPSFDVVRVEPTGSAVIAGRAAPNTSVSLVDKGEVIATVKTDANGQFAMVPAAPLAAGDHELALTSGPAGAPVTSTQSVTVAIPTKPSDKVIVALAEPDKPTVVLSDPRPAKPPAPSGALNSAATAPAPTLAIRTAEAGEDGSFYASGTAQPNSSLRLALNGSPVATATADPSGHWSLRVAKGMTPGPYAVRADQLDSKTGAVVSRTEVPFDLPPPTKAPATTGLQVASAGAPSAAVSDALVADLKSVKVTRGDNLWRISRRLFGRGVRYTLIYEANANLIRNERLIYPNQIFVLPKTD